MKFSYEEMDPSQVKQWEEDEEDEFAPGGWSSDTQVQNFPCQQRKEEQKLLEGSQQLGIIEKIEHWENPEPYDFGLGENESHTLESLPHKTVQPTSRQQSIKPDAPYAGYAQLTGITSQSYQVASDVKQSQTLTDIDDLFSSSEDGDEEPSLLQNGDQVSEHRQIQTVDADYNRDIQTQLPPKQESSLSRSHDADIENDEYDPAQPARDFSSVDPNHGCRCGGESTQCACVPGRCGCSGCPRNHADAGNNGAGQAQRSCVDDEQQDIPMDFGTTPITPTFPRVQNEHGVPEIPGLGKLSQGWKAEQAPRDSQPVTHNCQCGDRCRCPLGHCQYPRLDSKMPAEVYEPDRLSSQPLGLLIRKMASQCPSSVKANADYRYHHITVPANLSGSFHKQDCYSPQQGFRLVRSNMSATSSANCSSSQSTTVGTYPVTIPIAPSRPDTPRPSDTDVRQSVEPEMPLPNWHRDSTPAYTDRSPSPSPVSRHGDWDAVSMQEELHRIDGLSDAAMRDITPTALVPSAREFHHSRHISREGSIGLPSPLSYSRAATQIARVASPVGSASSSRYPMLASRSSQFEPRSFSPSPVRMYRDSTPLPSIEALGTPVPRPPIPPPPPLSILKPTKQRAKRKSLGVQGSKVEKAQSRNVTAKQRKATGKTVKQDAKDTKEAKEMGTERKEGKVKGAVTSIEETIMQKDGTPPRRSARNRGREGVVSYEGMGG